MVFFKPVGILQTALEFFENSLGLEFFKNSDRIPITQSNWGKYFSFEKMGMFATLKKLKLVHIILIWNGWTWKKRAGFHACKAKQKSGKVECTSYYFSQIFLQCELCSKKHKRSLSVTGFEPAISRFVAERVIRCATRMSYQVRWKLEVFKFVGFISFTFISRVL